MNNPDPDLYTSWDEFTKQLFWDFQMGEAFVLATAYYSQRVSGPVPCRRPVAGQRRARRRRVALLPIGDVDVTGDILHIRYQGTTDDARGHGPLEAGAGRLVAADSPGPVRLQPGGRRAGSRIRC